MKRYGNLWPQVCDRANIELAAANAIKGKTMTRDRKTFVDNRSKMLDSIESSLRNESYSFKPLYSFVVHEPKERMIHCSPFYPDKILHHCIMNVVLPLFMEKFTADTYGSIQGRGVAMAANKLKRVLYEHPDWYFLQIDAKKFYKNIDHDVVKQQVRRVIKCKNTLRMMDLIIDTHSEGLAIGVYPSQYLGNLVMSPIDHWAKEVLRTPYYFRYMDDILIVLPDKATAQDALTRIAVEFERLKLTIKNNIRIAPVTCGIDFIGYKFYPTHTRLRKRIKERMKRTVAALIKNEVSDRVFKLKTASHFGWCKHADCRHLIRSVFKEKIYIYEKNMEFKRLSEIKEAENWFGLSKDKRVSIESLFDVDIVFFEHFITTIKAETKIVVRFAYADKTDEMHYFITRSDVMRDRLERDLEHLPFIAKIKKVKNYTAYE